MKVRCNWCMSIFDEEDIMVDAEDKEHCPKCGAEGYLMDLTDRRTYVHELDIAPSYLTGVKAGFKRALFLKEDDRRFNTVELIILKGYDAYFNRHTGDECTVTITDIMRHNDYETIPEGWAILSIEVVG